MRRRRSLDVWPAFADLMTVLAIVGLFTTLALVHHGKGKEELISRLNEAERQWTTLQVQLEHQRREEDVNKERWSKERQSLEARVREAARNQKMFKAIQEAQRFIDEISRGSGLKFGADQSLQFGDDLVSFQLNSVEPVWKKDSQERLRRFCHAISSELEKLQQNSVGMRRLFVVQIEGHTDSSQCPGDPACNWWISSGRAASFVAFMRQRSYCPGGEILNLRPVGFADTRPLHEGEPPTRRITVRLVPDYDHIIQMLKGESRGV